MHFSCLPLADLLEQGRFWVPVICYRVPACQLIMFLLLTGSITCLLKQKNPQHPCVLFQVLARVSNYLIVMPFLRLFASITTNVTERVNGCNQSILLPALNWKGEITVAQMQSTRPLCSYDCVWWREKWIKKKLSYSEQCFSLKIASDCVPERAPSS